MALSLKDPETDRLARAIAKLTGESLTTTVKVALVERLERERLKRGTRRGIGDRLRKLSKSCAALPDVDPRDPDAIIGYDELGVPR